VRHPLRSEDILSNEYVHDLLNVEHGRQVEVFQVVGGTVPLRRERRDDQVHDGHTELFERHVVVFDGIMVQSLRLEKCARRGDPIA